MHLDLNVHLYLVQGSGVKRGQVMESESPVIISGYNSTTKIKGVDILIDTLAEVGATIWSLFGVTIFSTILLLMYRNKRTILSVFYYLMQKIPLRVFNIRTRVTSLLLEINLFFAVLIFCLLLHTNLVNVEPPIVINRYDDLIGRLDVQVSRSKEYPECTLFQQALDGSKEQRIRKEATRKSSHVSD